MTEQPEKPKWGKGKVFLFASLMIFLFVVVPALMIYYFIHKLSQIH